MITWEDLLADKKRPHFFEALSTKNEEALLLLNEFNTLKTQVELYKKELDAVQAEIERLKNPGIFPDTKDPSYKIIEIHKYGFWENCDNHTRIFHHFNSLEEAEEALKQIKG